MLEIVLNFLWGVFVTSQNNPRMSRCGMEWSIYLRLDRNRAVEARLDTHLEQWQLAALLIVGSSLSFTLRITKQKGIVLKLWHNRRENLWRINFLSSFCL